MSLDAANDVEDVCSALAPHGYLSGECSGACSRERAWSARRGRTRVEALASLKALADVIAT